VRYISSKHLKLRKVIMYLAGTVGRHPGISWNWNESLFCCLCRLFWLLGGIAIILFICVFILTLLCLCCPNCHAKGRVVRSKGRTTEPEPEPPLPEYPCFQCKQYTQYTKCLAPLNNVRRKPLRFNIHECRVVLLSNIQPLLRKPWNWGVGSDQPL